MSFDAHAYFYYQFFMRNEGIAIRRGPTETKRVGGERHEHDEGAHDLPQGVQELFAGLPASARKEIIERIQRTIEAPNQENRSLEEMVASFDENQREQYMSRCVDELLRVARMKERLQSLSPTELQMEMTRILDVLWSNRGKGEEELVLMNSGYYQDFFNQRETHVRALHEKEEAIEKKRASIDPKKRRATARMEKEISELMTECDRLKRELEEFDRHHENTDLDGMYFRNVKNRQRMEGKWTEAAAITLAYYESSEFATVMAERFDTMFYREARIADDPKVKMFGRTPDPEIRKRAQDFISAGRASIDEWFSDHEQDGKVRASGDAKKIRRRGLVIEYLGDLIASYRRGKADGRSDDEMTVTVRSIEVALNLLARNIVK